MDGRARWWLVGGVFVVLAVSSGFGFYNLSVYMNALVAERALAVADLSGATACLFVVSGLTGVAIGRLLERCDVRWIMLVGAAIGALALSLVGQVQEAWQAWLLYGLFGIGNSGVSLVPATTVVTRWFPGANRSLAMSVAATGLSVGGVVLSPASAQVIQTLGVGAAMPWFGVFYFVAIVATTLVLIRSWPAEDSERRREDRAVAATRAATAIRSRFFLGTAIAYVAIMAAQVGGIAHLFNHVAGAASHVVASASVSVLAGCSIVGRLLGGFVLTANFTNGEAFPIRAFTLINIVGQSAGLAVMGVANTPWGLLLGAGVFGISVGNLLMLQPLLLVQAFGVQRYPRLFAVANAIGTIGLAGGPLAMGVIHDEWNYSWSFLAAAAASATAFAVLLAAGRLPAPAERAR